MLKSYALGLFCAALAVLLVAAIWIGAQPKQEAGLLRGDRVYTSKQEFNGYLKTKGLSYKIWAARNPGAAPWEPDEFAIGAITVHASRTTVQLVLATVGWLLATVGALLFLRAGSPGMPGFATGSVALFSAVLVGLLVGGIWLSTKSKPEAGIASLAALEWGGKVYTSKVEFNGYLKKKGLSYKTWIARNPGAAPWEPATVRASPKGAEATTVREVTKAPEASEAHESWVGRPLLGAIALMVAAGCSLVVLLGRRPVTARLARGTVALYSPGALRIEKASAAMPTAAVASVRRLGLAASGATGRLRVSAPLYWKRLVGASRATAHLVARLMRERDISSGDVAYGLLAVMSAVMFALLVVFVLSG